ncbi:MAG TPA: hypothetical protein VE781_10550 [Kineosporiaceae bacterium]|nr:hypothetical protein [Kineosporiaceae bacterium]
MHLAPAAFRRLVAVEPNLDPWDGDTSVVVARQDEDDFVRTGFAALLASAAPAWRATLRLTDPVALHRTAVGLCVGPTPTPRETLLAASLPRTLVWGALSVPPSGLDELRAAGVAYALVPGAGHVPMEDAAPEFVRVLARALA